MRPDSNSPAVIVVALAAEASPDALLAVRATTLPVLDLSSDTPRQYLLDEIPGGASGLAQWLRAQPWCASAEALVADDDGASVVIRVLDPVLGTLIYGVRQAERGET